MPTASAHPAAVLDYASSRPQEAVLRRLRGAVIVLIFMFLGAGAGWLIDPRMYRAVGYLMVDPTQVTPSADVQSLDATQVQARQAAAVAGVAGSANAQVVATQLPSSMNVTTAMVMANLKVQAIPQSRLVAV